jgi:hypothetical protein
LVSYYQVVERDGLKRELQNFLIDFEAIQNELKQKEDRIEQFKTCKGMNTFKLIPIK